MRFKSFGFFGSFFSLTSGSWSLFSCFLAAVLSRDAGDMWKGSSFGVQKAKRVHDEPRNHSKNSKRVSWVLFKRHFDLVLICKDNCWSTISTPLSVASMLHVTLKRNIVCKPRWSSYLVPCEERSSNGRQSMAPCSPKTRMGFRWVV